MVVRVLFSIGVLLLLAGLALALALVAPPAFGHRLTLQDTLRGDILATPTPPTLTPSAPTPIPPTPVPVAPLVITIDSPSPGTLVGSPVVITGRTSRLPRNGVLLYRFVDSAGRQLGMGTFPVSGAPGQPGSFNASLTFNLPRDGGQVRIELIEQIDAAGQLFSAALDLVVDAQYQTITIDTPAPGTQVGSPVVISGRINQYPSSGQLHYRVIDSSGREIGAGDFAVDGAPGERGSFNASLTFNEPVNGGNIRVELSDPAINAMASIALTVAPPPAQAITIDTPAPGMQVGSPVVISGRINQYPSSGQLHYRVLDAVGQQLGAGSFPIDGAPGQPGSFTAKLPFSEPPNGGVIRLEVFDQADNGTIIASAALDLVVAPAHLTMTPTFVSLSTPTPSPSPSSPNADATLTVVAVAQQTQAANVNGTAAAQTAQARNTATSRSPTGTISSTGTLTGTTPLTSTAPLPGQTSQPTPVPPAAIFAEYPAHMDTGDSDTISVVLQIANAATPTIARLGRTVVAGVAEPGGTPGTRPSRAYGATYQAVAVAKLIAPGFVVEVADEEQSLDQPQLTWHWGIRPTSPGRHQVVTVVVKGEWQSSGGGQSIPPHELWSQDLIIDVQDPLLTRGQISVSSFVCTLLGSGLSLPWLIEQIRARRKRRTAQRQRPVSKGRGTKKGR
jgi:hypothetical protein